MPAPYFAKPCENNDHLAVEAAYRAASDGRSEERLLIVLLSSEGYRPSEIAGIVHRDTDTVLTWLHRWNESGFDGLCGRPYSGRPSVLNPEEQEKVIKWVSEEVRSGKRLTCRQIAEHISEVSGKTADHDSVRRMLHRHGCSRQKPGTKDHRADPDLQKKFREELRNRMDNEPQTRFFFTDEAIFQSAATVTSAWSPRGERPVIETNLSHEKIIEMGAAEPLTGDNFHLFVPFTAKESFTVFVKEFAKSFPDDKIVLIHDGASWHNIQSPVKNIELVKLPAYSPELNPIERLWQWIRNNFTHNIFFETINELEQTLTDCLKNQTVLRQAICSVCSINY